MEELKEVTVPYVVHEGEMTRMERTNHRLWILCIMLLVALLATNAGWIWYESQFEVVETQESYEINSNDGGNAVYNENGEVRINGVGEGNELYPWMNQAEITSDGFRDQMINNNVTSIRDGIGNLSTQLCGCCADVQQSLCNGFAGVNATVNSGFANAETAANARQMANMQTAFAGQTVMTQGFNALGSQFADCCCENRLGLADLKYTVATENCADRTQSMQNTRDIIDATNRTGQAIIDKLCALELDGVKNQLAQAQRENVGLQNQLNMAAFRESQANQNSLITQGFASEVDALYNRLNSCPVPTTPVYGRTPIFTCPQNQYGNCGCGCGGNF